MFISIVSHTHATNQNALLNRSSIFCAPFSMWAPWGVFLLLFGCFHTVRALCATHYQSPKDTTDESLDGTCYRPWRDCVELGEVEFYTLATTTVATSIGDAGAVALGEALQTNTALSYLNLGFNIIGDVGAAAIGEVLQTNTALTELYLSGNSIVCSNHGTARTTYPPDSIKRASRICKCSGIWSGSVCGTNVPGKKAIAAVVSLALLGVLIYAAMVVNRRYIQPYMQRREAERAFGQAHPIVVKTIAGDSYTLNDWGHCKDLKAALHMIAPDLGDPESFQFLDNDGWTAAINTTSAGSSSTSSSPTSTSTIVDTKYGSAHRKIIMQSKAADSGVDNFTIELTLVNQPIAALPSCQSQAESSV